MRKNFKEDNLLNLSNSSQISSNSLDKKYINKNNKSLKLFCNNCKKTPIINLNYKNEKILISHKCKKNIVSTSIEKFLDKNIFIKKNDKRKLTEIIGKENDIYIKNNIAKNFLENMSIKNLKSNNNKIDNSYYKKQIKNAENYLKNIENVKNYFNKKMNEINRLYNIYKDLNEKELILVKYLLNINNHKETKQSIKNILNILNFNLINNNFNNFDNNINEINFSLEDFHMFLSSTKNFILKETLKKIEEKKIIEFNNEHNNSIYCLLYLKDKRIASSGYDNNIFIYNKDSYEIDIKIKEHEGCVWFITQNSKENLISCSYDKTIKIFELFNDSYQILQVLTHHSDSVLKVIELHNGNLVSCSNDKNIIIWEEKSNLYLYKKTLEGHKDIVYSIIEINENEIVSASRWEKSLYFWNIKNNNNNYILNNIDCGSSSNCLFLINDKYFIVGGLNCIYIIDSKVYSIINIIDYNCEDSYMRCFYKINDNIILSANGVGNIQQWEINDKDYNWKLISVKNNIHTDYINSIIIDDEGKIFTCSDDKTIKIFYDE